MSNHPNRIARVMSTRVLNCVALAGLCYVLAACGTNPLEPAPAEQPAAVGTNPAPAPTCGDIQPSAREQLVQWVEMIRTDNPELQGDVAKWVQMTQEFKPAPVNITPPGSEKVAVSPTPLFGMGQITIKPVLKPAAPAKGSDAKGALPAKAFECAGISIHAKINSQVLVDGEGGVNQVGTINLDSGPDYIIVDAKMTLDSRIKVDFPGNAIYEPFKEEFTLSDRIHDNGDMLPGMACNVFVLGSEKKDELITRKEPDRTVVPELLGLMTSAPSKHTRGLAAIYLGIIRDTTVTQAMVDAMNAEKDDFVKAEIALGLGILGDTAALASIQSAYDALVNKNELGWMFGQAIDRLNGIRH